MQLARAKEVSEVVLKWTGNNPTGRVIVIHAGKHTCKGTCLNYTNLPQKFCYCTGNTLKTRQ